MSRIPWSPRRWSWEFNANQGPGLTAAVAFSLTYDGGTNVSGSITDTGTDEFDTAEELRAHVQDALDTALVAASLAAGDIVAVLEGDSVSIRLPHTLESNDLAETAIADARSGSDLVDAVTLTMIYDGVTFFVDLPAQVNATNEDLRAGIQLAVDQEMVGNFLGEAGDIVVSLNGSTIEIDLLHTLSGADTLETQISSSRTAAELNAGTNQIDLGDHNLQDGSPVQILDAGRVSGLSASTVYWVNVDDTNTSLVTFHTSSAAAIAGTGAVNISLGDSAEIAIEPYDDVTFTITPSTDVDTDANTIDVGTNDLADGDPIIFQSRSVIGGVEEGIFYFVSVDGTNIQLHPTAEDAQDGTNVVDLGIDGGAQISTLLDATTQSFNPVLDVDGSSDTIAIDEGHLLRDGDAVTYQGGGFIPGVESGDVYYVRFDSSLTGLAMVLNEESFHLDASTVPSQIDAVLTNNGNGTFDLASFQLTFQFDGITVTTATIGSEDDVSIGTIRSKIESKALDAIVAQTTGSNDDISMVVKERLSLHPTVDDAVAGTNKVDLEPAIVTHTFQPRSVGNVAIVDGGTLTAGGDVIVSAYEFVDRGPRYQHVLELLLQGLSGPEHQRQEGRRHRPGGLPRPEAGGADDPHGRGRRGRLAHRRHRHRRRLGDRQRRRGHAPADQVPGGQQRQLQQRPRRHHRR